MAQLCRAVASVTRGPRFESNHQQLLLNQYFLTVCRKDKNKGKEAGNGKTFRHSFQRMILPSLCTIKVGINFVTKSICLNLKSATFEMQ